MKTTKLVCAVLFAVLVFAAQSIAASHGAGKTGEELFRGHCAVCHTIKTLHKKDLDASGIKSPEDIIGKMRNPGEGMTQFDKTTISDEDAEKIAKYVLKTFQ
jgi:cytochrome c6